MVDKKTWDKVLIEIEKTGIILHACRKAGIDASTLHRQRKKDKKFAKQFDEAMEIGRANISDIGESALMRKVQEGDFGAIKYLLGHNSERYKTKQQDTFKYLFDHRSNKADKTPQVTFEDVIDKMAQDKRDGKEQEEIRQRERMRTSLNNALPYKPNGEQLYPWEVRDWEPQVSEWRQKVREALDSGTPLPSDTLKLRKEDAASDVKETAEPKPNPDPTPKKRRPESRIIDFSDEGDDD